MNYGIGLPCTAMLFGQQGNEAVGQSLEELGVSGLVMYYSNSASKSSGFKRLIAALKNNSIDVVHSKIIHDSPSREELEKEAKAVSWLFKKGGIGVIAVGGGSVIDAAKAVVYFAFGLDSQNIKKATPLIAAPTTAGSGSEVTRFAVIRNKSMREVLQSPLLIPKLAIIDGTFQEHLPKRVKASSAMDALTHAVETLGSQKANSITRCLSLGAIYNITKLAKKHCGRYNAGVAQQILEASATAGIANQAVGCGLAHAMAYSLTEQLDLPHGTACALALPLVVKFARDSVPSAYPGLESAVFNIGRGRGGFPEYAAKLIESMPLELDLYRLEDLDIKAATERSISIQRLIANTPAQINRMELALLFKGLVKIWKTK